MELYVIFGGQSSEHSVSVNSAYNILTNASREKYKVHGLYIHQDGQWSIFKLTQEITLTAFENLLTEVPKQPKIAALNQITSSSENKVFFPIIHGMNGEDGTIQGFLEYLNVPYTGCGILASAAGMEKSVTKLIAQSLQIPIAPYLCINRESYESNKDQWIKSIESHMAYPYFIKPSKGGSSIGIAPAHDREELIAAMEKAFLYDRKILVEKLVIGREIEFGILGNFNPECSLPGEFVRNPSFFDFNSKYLDDGLKKNIPADLNPEDCAKMADYALKIFKEIGGLGMSRVDFFYTDQGEILFNEINTAPGFTSLSMYPSLWKETKGYDTQALVDALIDLAIENYEFTNEQIRSQIK